MDSKLIHGLLFAACIALLVAIGFAVADILQYRGIEEQLPSRAAAPAQQMTVPAETPVAPPAARPAAPEGGTPAGAPAPAAPAAGPAPTAPAPGGQ